MKVSLFVNQDQGPRECTEEKQRGGTAEGNGRTKMTTDGPAEHTDAVRWEAKERKLLMTARVSGLSK